MRKEYRNSIKNKKLIKDTFIDLLMEKKDLNKITVKELVDRADIAKSTFYNHYDDIYAVVDEIEEEFLEILNETIDELEKQESSDYKLYLDKFLLFLKDNEGFYRSIIHSPAVRIYIDKLKYIMANRIISGPHKFKFSNDSRKRTLEIRFLTNACLETIVDYLRGDVDSSFGEIFDELIITLEKYQIK